MSCLWLICLIFFVSLCLFLFLFGVLHCSFSISFFSLSSLQIQNREAQKKDLTSRLEQARKQFTRDPTELEKLRQEANDLKSRLDQINAEREALKKKDTQSEWAVDHRAQNMGAFV